ncbi:MAG: YeeE/YedE family protein [Deltaproteobacteria bacterium]|nr:YeeE/YedE family protein [Deltaproteobacteria bacterium]
MNDEKQHSVLTGILSNGYQKIFEEKWPIWLGGLLIGIMSVITFAWARPWGVAGGLRNWGDWFFSIVGVYQQKPVSPLISTNSILTIGLLWGAFGSALLSKQFAIRKAPPLELLKGIVGGTLMGIGAAMAGGCNVGGFFTAVSALSASGIAMMIGLLAGAYVGLRYLYWELEHLPSGSAGGAVVPKEEKGIDWLKIEPYLGAVVFLAAIVCAWIYNKEAYTRVGGLLLCGIAFGFIIQRTRFCFVRGFREPFMTGESEVSKAIAISIIISVIGFAALKWSGLRGENVYVSQAFWFGGLVGGVIFGFGMVVAGGCGSGSVWRAGEGHTKLMLSVISFALSTSLFKAWIKSSEGLISFMGYRVFMPNFLTYKWSLILVIVIMLAFYIITTWNEETEKFVVEL